MIFIHGRVHADPHAGNIYFRAHEDQSQSKTLRPQLVILDHGLCHDLGDMRLTFCKYFQACCARDFECVKTLGRQLAGPLCKLLPLILSPWFALSAPDVSLSDIRAAANGRLPDSVDLRSIADFMTSARGEGSTLLGLLHSLGYTRGLLQALHLSEDRRLASMLKFAILGEANEPSRELTTRERLRSQWLLGCMQCQIHVLAPLAGFPVRRTCVCCKCGQTREQHEDDGSAGISKVY